MNWWCTFENQRLKKHIYYSNFSASAFLCQVLNELIRAFLGSRDLPSWDSFITHSTSIDSLPGIRNSHLEALILESVEIHCPFILIILSSQKFQSEQRVKRFGHATVVPMLLLRIEMEAHVPWHVQKATLLMCWIFFVGLTYLGELQVFIRRYLKELDSRLPNTPGEDLCSVVCDGQVQLKAMRTCTFAGTLTKWTLESTWKFVHNAAANVVEQWHL